MSKNTRDPIYLKAKQLIKKTLHSTMTAGPQSPEAVHELRVLSKKLRALLRLYHSDLPKSETAETEQQLKAFADQYANQRDHDVIQTTLSSIFARGKAPANQQYQKLELLKQYFSLRQTNRVGELAEKPDLALSAILHTWQKMKVSNQPQNFTASIQYGYNKSRKLSHQALRTGNDEDYHQCRKWLKYYQYQISLCIPLLSKPKQDHLQQVKETSELLGKLHDYAIFEQQLLSISRQTNNEPLRSAADAALKSLFEQKKTEESILPSTS